MPWQSLLAGVIVEGLWKVQCLYVSSDVLFFQTIEVSEEATPDYLESILGDLRPFHCGKLCDLSTTFYKSKPIVVLGQRYPHLTLRPHFHP